MSGYDNKNENLSLVAIAERRYTHFHLAETRSLRAQNLLDRRLVNTNGRHPLVLHISTKAND
jgi:hypothetical protein